MRETEIFEMGYMMKEKDEIALSATASVREQELDVSIALSDAASCVEYRELRPLLLKAQGVIAAQRMALSKAAHAPFSTKPPLPYSPPRALYDIATAALQGSAAQLAARHDFKAEVLARHAVALAKALLMEMEST